MKLFNNLKSHTKVLSNFYFQTIPKNFIHNASQTSAGLDLSGIFPPVPTPFDKQNGSVSYDELKKNFDKWNSHPFKGYLVQGSNGEYVYLSFDERIEVIRNARDFIGTDKLLLAGSGCESTRDTVYMSNKMAEAGADAVMVVTPCYYKSGMKDSAMINHYEALADGCQVPVILYNVPAYTGVELSVNAIKTLAKHSNIIGVKESGGDITKIGTLIDATSEEDFQIMAGSAGFLLAALHLGCVGGVCALANVLGKEVCQLHSLFIGGKMSEALKLQKQLIAPNSAVTKDFGVPGLKKMMDLLGFYGGPTRSPLQNLSPQESLNIGKIFKDSGF